MIKKVFTYLRLKLINKINEELFSFAMKTFKKKNKSNIETKLARIASDIVNNNSLYTKKEKKRKELEEYINTHS